MSLLPRIVICAVLMVVVLSNCDTLEEDILEPVIPTEGVTNQVVLSGQTTVIDLASVVNVTVPVKTDITKEPTFGKLSVVGDGIY